MGHERLHAVQAKIVIDCSFDTCFVNVRPDVKLIHMITVLIVTYNPFHLKHLHKADLINQTRFKVPT